MKASLIPPKLPPPPGWYPWPPTPTNIFGYFKPSYLIRVYFRSKDPMGADTYFQSWDKEVAEREILEEQVQQALEIIQQEEEDKLDEIRLRKQQQQQQQQEQGEEEQVKGIQTGPMLASTSSTNGSYTIDYKTLARNLAVKGAVSADSYLPIVRNFVKERAAMYRNSISSFVDGYKDGFASEIAQHTEFSTKGVIEGLKKMEGVLEEQREKAEEKEEKERGGGEVGGK